MFFSLTNRSRVTRSQVRRGPWRSLLLERLEDRTLLSLKTGTILVANSPSVQNQSTFNGLESTPTGIVAIDPSIPIALNSQGQPETNQPNQSAFAARQGLLSTPVSIAKDSNGNFFVADRTAFGRGSGRRHRGKPRQRRGDRDRRKAGLHVWSCRHYLPQRVSVRRLLGHRRLRNNQHQPETAGPY